LILHRPKKLFEKSFFGIFKNFKARVCTNLFLSSLRVWEAFFQESSQGKLFGKSFFGIFKNFKARVCTNLFSSSLRVWEAFFQESSQGKKVPKKSDFIRAIN